MADQTADLTAVFADLTAVFDATSTGALVDAVIRLTHRIHTCDVDTGAEREDLRRQRNMVRAEIIRRAGA